MRGFLASALGLALLLLLLPLYMAWLDTAHIHSSLHRYGRMLADVYKRAAFEDDLRDTLERWAAICRTEKLSHCLPLLNAEVVALVERYNLDTCPSPIAAIPGVSDVRFILVCPITGRIGTALVELKPGSVLEV